MSSEPGSNPEDQSKGPNEPFSQEVQHTHVSARVPEKVGRGVFSTGVMILQGSHEFVLDFALRMASPHQIVARVVLPISLVPSLIAAMRDNLAGYQSRFGPPPALPAPPNPPPPAPIEEIYSQLKLPDELMSGVYANAVMIAHTPAEFAFDFITNFYPKSAVSCRVFLSAPQVPGFLNTLTRSWQQFQQKQAGFQPPPPPTPPTT
jgi:hypothetical protein